MKNNNKIFAFANLLLDKNNIVKSIILLILSLIKLKLFLMTSRILLLILFS